MLVEHTSRICGNTVCFMGPGQLFIYHMHLECISLWDIGDDVPTCAKLVDAYANTLPLGTLCRFYIYIFDMGFVSFIFILAYSSNKKCAYSHEPLTNSHTILWKTTSICIGLHTSQVDISVFLSLSSLGVPTMAPTDAR